MNAKLGKRQNDKIHTNILSEEDIDLPRDVSPTEIQITKGNA